MWLYTLWNFIWTTDIPSFSQEVSIANISLVRNGTLCPLRTYVLGFCLIWICEGLRCSVPDPVCSYMYHTCCVWKILFSFWLFQPSTLLFDLLPSSVFIFLGILSLPHFPYKITCYSLYPLPPAYIFNPSLLPNEPPICPFSWSNYLYLLFLSLLLPITPIMAMIFYCFHGFCSYYSLLIS